MIQKKCFILIICMFIFSNFATMQLSEASFSYDEKESIPSSTVFDDYLDNYDGGLDYKTGILDVQQILNPYYNVDNSRDSVYSSKEIIIKFKDTDAIFDSAFSSLNSRYAVESVQKLDSFDFDDFSSNIFKIEFSNDVNIDSVLHKYQNCPAVEYAEPNYIYKILSTPDDTYFDDQWALNQSSDKDIDAPEAWDITTGNSNVVIALIDTGVDWNHPDLADNIWNNTDESLNGTDADSNGYINDIRGWDFYNNDSNPMDDNGHGTHCSGIIGAIGNNSIGVSGVCWNISIMPIKAMSSSGYAFAADLTNAINYAVNNSADVISMSWGGYFESLTLKSAIEYAYDQGVVLVAAAGNDNINSEVYPAAYDEVISVAATNETDEKASFSNWGSWIDVCAPGVDIYSTMYDDTYSEETGTSLACPVVAGVAGLILSNNSSLSNIRVKNILETSSEAINSDYYIGVGRVNAYRSLMYDQIPMARLNETVIDSELRGNVYINGTANGSYFTNFSLSYGAGYYPSFWTEITSSSTQVNNSVFAQWNTSEIDDGLYTLKLEVNCSNNFTSIDEASVKINNIIETIYVGGSGPNNYSTIANALNDAGNGDTVFIYNGTYNESVMVNSNIDIIGDNNETIVIGDLLSGYAFWINSERCNISNMNIQNSIYGLVYTSNSNSLIENNYFNNTLLAIAVLSNSSSYAISPVALSGSSIGNTTVANNTLKNYLFGVVTMGDQITITNNSLNGDYYYDIFLAVGMQLMGANCTIINNYFTKTCMAIYNLYFNHSVVESNEFYNNDYNILIGYSHHNQIRNNSIDTGSTSGINFGYVSNNTFYNNSISNITGDAFSFYLSSNNIFYFNTLKNNTRNAIDNNNNTWYNPDFLIGNYWDNYTGLDANEDGIGDTPYDIGGGENQDLYPLMYERVTPPVFVWVDDNYTSSTPGWNVDHFDTIQKGIDNITENGTVYVYNGTYYENVIITQAVNLTGENKNDTIVDGSNQDDVIVINASSVTIKGFTIRNSGSTIWAPTWDSGIDIGPGFNSITIQDNLIINNTYGIQIRWYCENNTISSNFIYNTTEDGLDLTYCNYTEISNNTFTFNQQGIEMMFSNNNLILNNNISSCIETHNRSMYLAYSSNNTISNNCLNNCDKAITLDIDSNYNLIQNNSISDNGQGIELWKFSEPANHDNIITKNNISNNLEFGIEIKSNNNSIYHNNLINNGLNANDTGNNNTWYNTTLLEGNYWDDYNGSDIDGDNIGDTPYNISGGDNSDLYPLIYQYNYYYNLSVSAPAQVNEGDVFTVTVTTPSGAHPNMVYITFGEVINFTATGQLNLTAPSVSENLDYTIIATSSGYTNGETNITVVNVAPSNDNRRSSTNSDDSDSTQDMESTVTNPPVADPGGPYEGYLSFEEITFDGSGSTDNGTIEDYTWNFGDGNTGYGVKPVHSYSSGGKFTVTLTVTDNDGLTDSNTTSAIIALDSDGDGWSDEDEIRYGSNISDTNDVPLDTDGDLIPDEDDEDDDNDGLIDIMEVAIGLNPKNSSDSKLIEIEGSKFYLIDTNEDNIYDQLFNVLGSVTDTGITEDGKILLDIDGDYKWDYYYDPANSQITEYAEKEMSYEMPWVMIIIIITIIAVVLIIGILFKLGFFSFQKNEY